MRAVAAIANCANPSCGKLFKKKAPRLKCCSLECGIAYKRTPEYRARMHRITKEDWVDNPNRLEGVERCREKCRTPENRERCSEENRRRWSDSTYAAKVAASNMKVQGDEAHRKAASERLKAKWRDDQWRHHNITCMTGVKKGEGIRTRITLLEIFINGGLSLEDVATEIGLPLERVEERANELKLWPRPWKVSADARS